MPSPYDPPAPRRTIKVGEALYIKSKNTRVMQQPGLASSNNVLAILQPLTMVRWLGAVPGTREWQKVSHNGRVGYVYSTNLSIDRPDMTLRASYCDACDGTGAVMAKSAHPNVCAFETCAACGGNGQFRGGIKPSRLVPSGAIKA
jgi:hypothetical protein